MLTEDTSEVVAFVHTVAPELKFTYVRTNDGLQFVVHESLTEMDDFDSLKKGDKLRLTITNHYGRVLRAELI